MPGEPEILPLDYRLQLIAAVLQHRVDAGTDLDVTLGPIVQALYDAYDAALAGSPDLADSLHAMVPTPPDMLLRRVTEGPVNG